MRAIFISFLIALIVGGVSASCGSVKAKPDAGEGSGADDAAMPDALGCVADSFSCGADNALYQCDSNGNTLSKVQDCQYGCSNDHCNECAANTTFCSGSELVMCDANGMIVNPQTCTFGCQMDSCNACAPNTKYCDGSNSVTCGSDGQPASTMSCASGCLSGVCNSCTPNTTTCDGDTLVVCNAAGTVQSATTCALGCSTNPSAHCEALVPSYGVPAPTGTLPSLTVSSNATLNISNCSMMPGSVSLTMGGTTTSIVGSPQVLVHSQSGPPPICIVRFDTISIAQGVALDVVNSQSPGHVLSLQAVGPINIAGSIRFFNSADGPSPGTSVPDRGLNGNGDHKAAGAGGAGAANAGGTGGACQSCSNATPYTFLGGTGGPAVTTINTLLTGGSRGGNVTNGASTWGFGGQGGGGLQLISNTSVTLAATGVINLNGSGGRGLDGGMFSSIKDLPAGGGGSGGTLVVEAPAVTLSAGAIVVANGGGGAGGCYTCNNLSGACSHINGQSGQLSASRARGGDCPPYPGDGGSESYGDTVEYGHNSDMGAVSTAGGGGGGSYGFIFLRARTSAAVMVDSLSVVSPQPTIGVVTSN